MNIKMLVASIMDTYEKMGKIGSVNCSDAEIKDCIIEKIEFIISNTEYNWTADFVTGMIFGEFASYYNNLDPDVIKKEVKKEMG